MTNHEIIDIVDDAGNVTGTVSRTEAEKENRTIQNVIVFVFNSLGRVWVQKRPMHKRDYKGLWDVSACGAVLSGEDKQVAAEREQQEEMGFTSDLQYVDSFINVFPDETDTETRKRLSHVFVGIDDQVPQPNEEVDEFKAWEPGELKTDIKERPEAYIPSFMTELDIALAGYREFVEK